MEIRLSLTMQPVAITGSNKHSLGPKKTIFSADHTNKVKKQLFPSEFKSYKNYTGNNIPKVIN